MFPVVVRIYICQTGSWHAQLWAQPCATVEGREGNNSKLICAQLLGGLFERHLQHFRIILSVAKANTKQTSCHRYVNR